MLHAISVAILSLRPNDQNDMNLLQAFLDPLLCKAYNQVSLDIMQIVHLR